MAETETRVLLAKAAVNFTETTVFFTETPVFLGETSVVEDEAAVFFDEATVAVNAAEVGFLWAEELTQAEAVCRAFTRGIRRRVGQARALRAIAINVCVYSEPAPRP